MANLEVGQPAPDVRLETHAGQTLSLSDLRGKKVVLYFYPKASTPGCTTEACEFRDLTSEFEARNAVVVGISPDKPASQEKFRGKYDLPFTLLCDVDKSAADAYGAWKNKKLYGRTFLGIERSTFVIDEQGRLTHIFRGVKAAGHAAKVLASL